MSVRELVVLGTASQVPTRHRNHNGYLLRWDGDGFLFDPGEGTQRQMTFAGVSAHDVTHICLTHFHGDHCLGLPGVLQRMSLDRVPYPVHLHYPRDGQPYLDRLRHASIHHATVDVREHPVDGAGVHRDDTVRLETRPLSHPVTSVGYRITAPDRRKMIPRRLAEEGLHGPTVGRLQREGAVTVDGRRVRVEDVSYVAPGQRFAFVMDTRLCDGAYELAAGAGTLVCESTFLHRDTALAEEYGHLTAVQAAEIAVAGGVRRLVLTHLSGRYGQDEEHRFLDEARQVFAGAGHPGEVRLAADLDRIPLRSRLAPSTSDNAE